MQRKKMLVAGRKSKTLIVGVRLEPEVHDARPHVGINNSHNHTMVFRAVRGINRVTENVSATQPLTDRDSAKERGMLAVQQPASADESTDLKSVSPGIARDGSVHVESGRYDLKQMVRVFERLAVKPLDAHGVRCEFAVEPDPGPFSLSQEKCRSIRLMFKETLSYITHHIRCGAVGLSISVKRERLEVEIREDECVLFASTSGKSGGRDGEVLRRMQARIVEAAGTLQLATTPAGGSLVTLTVPLVNVE